MNSYEFAEKLVNNIPFVKTSNILVEVGPHSISYKPRDGDSFYGMREVSDSFMTRLGGIIDGAKYAYEELEKDGNINRKKLRRDSKYR